MRGQLVHPLAGVVGDPLDFLLVEEVGLDFVPFYVAFFEDTEPIRADRQRLIILRVLLNRPVQIHLLRQTLGEDRRSQRQLEDHLGDRVGDEVAGVVRLEDLEELLLDAFDALELVLVLDLDDAEEGPLVEVDVDRLAVVDEVHEVGDVLEGELAVVGGDVCKHDRNTVPRQLGVIDGPPL